MLAAQVKLILLLTGLAPAGALGLTAGRPRRLSKSGNGQLQ